MTRTLVLILLLAAMCAGLGGCVSVSQTSAPTSSPAPLPTLSPSYPADRLPLPEGSAVKDFTSIVDGDKLTESIVLTLPLKKAEAMAYFKPLLEKDAEMYTESEVSAIPLEIQGAYPDAASQTELFARYSQEAFHATVLRVSIYTLADQETVAAIQIQVTYREKPQ